MASMYAYMYTFILYIRAALDHVHIAIIICHKELCVVSHFIVLSVCIVLRVCIVLAILIVLSICVLLSTCIHLGVFIALSIYIVWSICMPYVSVLSSCFCFALSSWRMLESGAGFSAWLALELAPLSLLSSASDSTLTSFRMSWTLTFEF